MLKIESGILNMKVFWKSILNSGIESFYSRIGNFLSFEFLSANVQLGFWPANRSLKGLTHIKRIRLTLTQFQYTFWVLLNLQSQFVRAGVVDRNFRSCCGGSRNFIACENLVLFRTSRIGIGAVIDRLTWQPNCSNVPRFACEDSSNVKRRRLVRMIAGDGYGFWDNFPVVRRHPRIVTIRVLCIVLNSILEENISPIKRPIKSWIHAIDDQLSRRALTWVRREAHVSIEIAIINSSRDSILRRCAISIVRLPTCLIVSFIIEHNLNQANLRWRSDELTVLTATI